jgi:hypothetical protein
MCSVAYPASASGDRKVQAVAGQHQAGAALCHKQHQHQLRRID